jgi:NAD(P)-dependent dehydrogenase (short-subunit alcohol dehydrogenase family)
MSGVRSFPRSPLIIGASGGIGAAMARLLPEAARLSRSDEGLELTDEASVASAAARFSDKSFDLIFVATGVLESAGARPEKSFAELSPEAMARVYAANAIGPALLFKHFAPLLPLRERGVFAFLSARVGSIGDNRLGGWMSYRASKAALNQIVRCAAIELSRTRPDAIALALHPGTIDTALTRKYAGGRFTASPSECAENLLRLCAVAAPDMSGRFFAYDGAEIPW